jgi:osomolarity two-component system sensor histidine kinase SLN1
VCVFSIGFGVCVATFLLSGWVVKPITRLQAATEQYSSNISKSEEYCKFWKFFKFFKRPDSDDPNNFSEKQVPYTSSTGSEFRIPEQVVTREYIKDELTELTETFNEMTSELRKQYAVLEERVVQRTKEIKAAKVHAETANEAKSLFIANITHELRTPLNGILGMAAVSMEEKDPQNTREALKIIFKSGELLLRLLTDLLGFSKRQVNNMKLKPKGFLIAEVTAQLNAIFYEQSRSNKINFSIQVHNQSLFRLELLGDINRILQVVMNLVSNSFKFTPSDGEIAVDISASLFDGSDLTSFDEFLQNSSISSSDFSLPVRFNLIHLTISVRDNGPGIAPHLQSKIFEPFVQGDLDLSEKRGGVGLGLSICVQLARLMNGQISLDSELGRGSTFSFSMPLNVIRVLDSKEIGSMPVHPAISPSGCSKIFPVISDHSPDDNNDHAQKLSNSDVQNSNPRGVSRPFNNISVLIAEDNKVNQEVLLKMLKLEGIRNMKVAKDGVEAVNAVKTQMQDKKSFDIIFMDIQMPNLDGKQATEIIRNELYYQGTIIAVSAFTDHSNIEDCLAVGMNHFLAKPLRRPQLHSLLEDLQNWCPSE